MRLPAVCRRRAALDEYNRLLDQYMQLPRSAGGGGRLTQVLLARWKLMGAAPAFCDAFTKQPPESVDRACACCAYLQVRPDGGLAVRCNLDRGLCVCANALVVFGGITAMPACVCVFSCSMLRP